MSENAHMKPASQSVPEAATTGRTDVPTWDEWVAANPAETPQERHLRHSRWLHLRREQLAAEAAAAEAAVADLPDADLILRLVAFVDGRHETDSNSCRPRVPEDCTYYCRACEALRLVSDPILRAVRARRAADEVAS